ncbi:MAG: 50S ribosomal protein L10 [Phycisphaerae bacterium]|nr:50S ribosomal protein L10 [Phycisphaerae bacterium]
MSKPVKELIVKEYRKRFDGIEAAVLVEIRGMDALSTNKMRNEFASRSVRVTVVKNHLARQALKGGAFESLSSHFSGPSALVYGQGSVIDLARDLVKWAKGNQNFVFKAAVLDGVVYEGPAGVHQLSKLPTRAEAQSQLVTLVLSPARNLLGAAIAPGANVLGIVKEIQARLEKGETISAKAG